MSGLDQYERRRRAQRQRHDVISTIGLGVTALVVVAVGFAVRVGFWRWILAW